MKVWKFMHYLLQQNQYVHGPLEILYRIVESLAEGMVTLKVRQL